MMRQNQMLTSTPMVTGTDTGNQPTFANIVPTHNAPTLPSLPSSQMNQPSQPTMQEITASAPQRVIPETSQLPAPQVSLPASLPQMLPQLSPLSMNIPTIAPLQTSLPGTINFPGVGQSQVIQLS
jgi:hypothetical protein